MRNGRRKRQPGRSFPSYQFPSLRSVKTAENEGFLVFGCVGSLKKGHFSPQEKRLCLDLKNLNLREKIYVTKKVAEMRSLNIFSWQIYINSYKSGDLFKKKSCVCLEKPQRKMVEADGLTH